MKKFFSFFFKLVIAFTAFYYIFSNTDFNGLLLTIQNADLRLILISMFIVVLNVFVLAERWRVTNLIFNIDLPTLHLAKHYFIAFFFNNFLPSSMGGDFWKIKRLMEEKRSKLQAFIPPFLERITGLIAIVFILPFSFYVFHSKLLFLQFSGFFYVSIALLLGVLSTLIFPKALSVLKMIGQRFFSENVANKFRRVFETLELIHLNRKQIWKAVGYSLLTQLVFALAVFFISESVAGNINYIDIYLIQIFVYIAGALPISPNGLGVNEAVLITCFTSIGVQAEQATSIALMVLMLKLVPSVPGGILFLLNKRHGGINET